MVLDQAIHLVSESVYLFIEQNKKIIYHFYREGSCRSLLRMLLKD